MSFFLPVTPCYAASSNENESLILELNELQNQLPSDAKAYLKDIEIIDIESFHEIGKHLLDDFYLAVQNSIAEIKLPLIQLAMLIILSTFLDSIISADHHFFVNLFVCTEILFLTVSESKSFFITAVSAIQQLYDFSTVLLPCLTAAALAAGASVSAGVKYSAAALFMNILLNFANSVLIPIISAYLVMMSGGCMFQQTLMTTLGNLLRKGCKLILTGGTILFTAYLNIAGLISSSGDLLALKVTKTVIASTLPVVGNIISGASSSLVAGAALLRNCIGIFGLLAILGTLLAPFAALGVRYVLFLLFSNFAELFPQKSVSDLIKAIAGAYGMMLGTLGTGFILIFMTLISFMQVTGGIA